MSTGTGGLLVSAGLARPLECSRRVAGGIRLGCGPVRQSGRLKLGSTGPHHVSPYVRAEGRRFVVEVANSKIKSRNSQSPGRNLRDYCTRHSTKEVAACRCLHSFCLTCPPALVVPSPAAVPAAQPGLSLHLPSRTRPGRRRALCAGPRPLAAVTTSVTVVLRSCPDGAVRTLTSAVRAWFVTPGP